ncbi:MAG: hypothetical protein ABEJ83_00560 [Candidatus Nanohaloarchaea archaeon]
MVDLGPVRTYLHGKEDRDSEPGVYENSSQTVAADGGTVDEGGISLSRRQLIAGAITSAATAAGGTYYVSQSRGDSPTVKAEQKDANFPQYYLPIQKVGEDTYEVKTRNLDEFIGSISLSFSPNLPRPSYLEKEIFVGEDSARAKRWKVGDNGWTQSFTPGLHQTYDIPIVATDNPNNWIPAEISYTNAEGKDRISSDSSIRLPSHERYGKEDIQVVDKEYVDWEKIDSGIYRGSFHLDDYLPDGATDISVQVGNWFIKSQES